LRLVPADTYQSLHITPFSSQNSSRPTVYHLTLNYHCTWHLLSENYIIINTRVRLIFVPCIIRRSRNNQHNSQVCSTALFHMLTPTYFGISLPSSGSYWIRLSYVKMQIDVVVYLKYSFITDKNQCVKHLV
jgi:hypothetical protein